MFDNGSVGHVLEHIVIDIKAIFDTGSADAGMNCGDSIRTSPIERQTGDHVPIGQREHVVRHDVGVVHDDEWILTPQAFKEQVANFVGGNRVIDGTSFDH